MSGDSAPKSARQHRRSQKTAVSHPQPAHDASVEYASMLTSVGRRRGRCRPRRASPTAYGRGALPDRCPQTEACCARWSTRSPGVFRSSEFYRDRILRSELPSKKESAFTFQKRAAPHDDPARPSRRRSARFRTDLRRAVVCVKPTLPHTDGYTTKCVVPGSLVPDLDGFCDHG